MITTYIRQAAKAVGIRRVEVLDSETDTKAQLTRLTAEEDLPILIVSWDIEVSLSWNNNGFMNNPETTVTCLLLGKPEDKSKATLQELSERMGDLYALFIDELRNILSELTNDSPLTNVSYKLLPKHGITYHSGVLGKFTSKLEAPQIGCVMTPIPIPPVPPVVGAEITVSNLATFSAEISDQSGLVTIDFGDGSIIDFVVSTDINTPTYISYNYLSPFTGIIKLQSNTITALFVNSEGLIADVNVDGLISVELIGLSLDSLNTNITLNNQTLKSFSSDYFNSENINLVGVDLSQCIAIEYIFISNNNSLVLPVVNSIDISYFISEPERSELLILLDTDNPLVQNGIIHATSFNFADPLVQQAHDNLVARGWVFDIPIHIQVLELETDSNSGLYLNGKLEVTNNVNTDVVNVDSVALFEVIIVPSIITSFCVDNAKPLTKIKFDCNVLNVLYGENGGILLDYVKFNTSADANNAIYQTIEHLDLYGNQTGGQMIINSPNTYPNTPAQSSLQSKGWTFNMS